MILSGDVRIQTPGFLDRHTHPMAHSPARPLGPFLPQLQGGLIGEVRCFILLSPLGSHHQDYAFHFGLHHPIRG